MLRPDPLRVAAVAVALALTGCGATKTIARAPAAAPVPRDGELRWLAATTGPAPSIADENRARGSVAWRGGDRDTRRSGIDVYVSDQNARPGETLRVYVRAHEPTVRVRLFRIGWYGGRGGRLIAESGRMPVAAQPACTHTAATGLTECSWHPTLTTTLPASLPSGVYIVNILGRHDQQRDALFILRAAAPAPIVAHISTATWEAYNDWGGDSLYPGGRPVLATASSQGVAVSYDRPYATTTGAGQFFFRDAAMVRFLERYGYPVSYTGSADHPPLAGARAALDIGHSEYWSVPERDSFVTARDAGTSLAFFSSDTLAWRVVYTPAGAGSSEAGASGHRIIAYKEFAARDPKGAARTGAFSDGGAALTGSAYVGCISPRRAMTPRVMYRYYDWAPSPARGPAWLFAGTGFSAASHVSEILGYETDERISMSAPGTSVVGGGTIPCRISGEYGPAPPRGRANRGDTTLYTARSGALVFATGTLGWGFGLAPLVDPSADVARRPAPGLVRLTRNLLARMLAPAAR